MGWAERNNPNSSWSKKRVMNMSSNVASPISNNPKIPKVPTPAKDEPMVIEITPTNVFQFLKDFLCRMLKLAPRPQSPAPIS